MSIKQAVYKLINWSDLIPFLMEELVITQSEFAHRLGTKQQSISNWISRKRTPNEIVAKRILEICSYSFIDINQFIVSCPKRLQDYQLSHREKRILKRLNSLTPGIRDDILSDLFDLSDIYIKRAKMNKE